MNRGVSTGVLVGVVMVVAVVIIAAVMLIPRLLRPHTTRLITSPLQEIALNNSLALLKSQYTMWGSMKINIAVIITIKGLSLTVPAIYINSSNLEVSWTDIANKPKLYINGPATINYTTSLFTSPETLRSQLVMGIYRNGSQLCAITGQPMAYKLSDIPLNYTGLLTCGSIPNVQAISELATEIMYYVYGNLTYIGNEVWNGQTTYCFTTRKPVIMQLTQELPTLVGNNVTGIKATLTVRINRLCLLENGIATYVKGSAALVVSSPKATSTVIIHITENLIRYTTVFDAQGFNALLSHPYIFVTNQKVLVMPFG